jgi:hypothetical protein
MQLKKKEKSTPEIHLYCFSSFKSRKNVRTTRRQREEKKAPSSQSRTACYYCAFRVSSTASRVFPSDFCSADK